MAKTKGADQSVIEKLTTFSKEKSYDCDPGGNNCFPMNGQCGPVNCRPGQGFNTEDDFDNQESESPSP